MSENEVRTLIHDARNPLNRISMQAELALMLAEREPNSPNLVKALNIILSACAECDTALQSISEISLPAD